MGTNPKAKASGNFLEEERIGGWIHVALGDDSRFDGGKTESPVHLDGVLKQASLELDGRVVVDRGRILR